MNAVKAVRRFLNASVWDDYVVSQFGPGGLAHTDEEIEHYVRNQTATIYHPVGTARMSAVGAKSGGVWLAALMALPILIGLRRAVVNPDLRVKNAKGLRVIDASVIVSFFRWNVSSVRLVSLFIRQPLQPYIPAANTQASSDLSATKLRSSLPLSIDRRLYMLLRNEERTSSKPHGVSTNHHTS